MDCKVVFGCCATGFENVTGPMTYMECVVYLMNHIDGDDINDDRDPHYTPMLDIMNVETGRLMSYVLPDSHPVDYSDGPL